MKKYILDNEEQELLESLESDEWESIENINDEIKKHQEIAKNTLKEYEQEVVDDLNLLGYLNG